MAYQNHNNNRNNNRNNNYRNRNNQNRGYRNNNQRSNDRNFIDRNELKKEYLRGVQETEALHKKSRQVLLDMIREKATEIINDAESLVEAQDMLEEMIQIVDDYDNGKISAQELVDIKEEKDSNFTLDSLQKQIDGLHKDGDEIISLTEFVRKDF